MSACLLKNPTPRSPRFHYSLVLHPSTTPEYVYYTLVLPYILLHPTPRSPRFHLPARNKVARRWLWAFVADVIRAEAIARLLLVLFLCVPPFGEPQPETPRERARHTAVDVSMHAVYVHVVLGRNTIKAVQVLDVSTRVAEFALGWLC